METISDHLKLSELSELLEGRYTLPAKPAEVALFKGAMFNVQELARQLTPLQKPFQKLTKSALDSAAKRPILPLNVSQVGLATLNWTEKIRACYSREKIIREYDLTASAFERWTKRINNTGSTRERNNRTPEQEELLKLRKENTQLKMENDALYP